MQTPLDSKPEGEGPLDARPLRTAGDGDEATGCEATLSVVLEGLPAHFSIAELEVIETYMVDILDQVLG